MNREFLEEMQKELVPPQQALQIMQLGFDKPCFITDSLGFIQDEKVLDELKLDKFKNPTFSQAFKFFREQHGLHSYIDEWKFLGGLAYDYVIVSDDIGEDYDGRKWKTVKEAQLACLIELIEIANEINISKQIIF